MVVRPGFVHTRMTEGRDPAPFSTTPEAVADEIAKGLAKGAEVVWAPPILRYLFSTMRHLPRPVWRKVSAR
jgi:decaprenylphospho-beta-D-erythro-pentofuranosid-2-ulose 2-reductase